MLLQWSVLMDFARSGFLTAAAEQTERAPSGGMSPLLLFGLLALAFWMIVMRPGRREKQDRQRKLDAIKKGDRVISIGGIHGKVSEVDHNAGVITVEVAPKIPIKFSKAAIQVVETRGTDKADGKPGEAKAGE